MATIAPEPLPCPSWCHRDHRLDRLDQGAEYRARFHDSGASAELGVTVSRTDEWFAHEGPQWRTVPTITVKTPAGTLTFQQTWELGHLFALGPAVQPGLLAAVRAAAELVGIELPREAAALDTAEKS